MDHMNLVYKIGNQEVVIRMCITGFMSVASCCLQHRPLEY